MAEPARPITLAPPSNAGFRNWIRRLPDQVAEAEEEGRPIIVEFPPTLEPEHQALLATLGVLVRFKNEPPAYFERRHRGGS